MGIIIAKLKFGKKKTTYEVLDKLENEIQSIEEFRRSTEQARIKIVRRFFIISVCVYLITAVVLYFYFFPASVYERLLYVVPLVILPVLIVLFKRVLTWYYSRQINKKQKKLSTLKDEKKKILEEVMDKESYKVACTILEKFAPEKVKKQAPDIMSTPMRPQAGPLAAMGHNQTGLRHRGPPMRASLGDLGTPNARPALMPASPMAGPLQAFTATPRPMPRNILPKDRTVLDKMIDYLVGDGPSNRFALICKNCAGHNGMALSEEYEYLSFKCCYCFMMNPSRKKRPIAPKLEASLAITQHEVGNSDSSSSSESEVEGPIVTEPQESEKESGEGDDAELESTPTAMDVDSVDEVVNAGDLDSENQQKD